VAVGLAATVAGCSSDAPGTAPGKDNPLILTALSSPSVVKTFALPQSLTFTGTNFALGMTVTMTPPSGGTTVFSESSQTLTVVSNTSVRVSATLTSAGSYSFVAKDGAKTSPALTVVVQQSADSDPPPAIAMPITAVTPASPAVSSAVQSVVITGSNFGLINSGSKLTVTSPNGVATDYIEPQFLLFSTSELRISLSFPTAGDYKFQFTRPSAGLVSNVFTITAR
jgi:hypothetical protein